MTVSQRNALILTQSVYGGNYGGILQAYALQKVMKELGVNTKTLAPSPDLSAKATIQVKFRNMAKFILSRLTGRSYSMTPLPREKMEITAKQREFVARRMDLESRRPTVQDLLGYDTFVVGSDQVWRAAYSDIPTHFLDFTGQADVKRISYAASFGHDTLIGYSPDLVKQCASWLSKFDRVSVREEVGIEICASEFQAQAVRVLDPTMLLTRQDYLDLVQTEIKPDDSPTMLQYVLDSNPEFASVAAKIENHLHYRVSVIHPSAYRGSRTYRSQPEEHVNPSIANWLRGFAAADFVVTDSFHGTVFAILFNKPFVALANASRGTSRFETLLSIFGLQDRLVTQASEVDAVLKGHQIDWAKVNEVLEAERRHSFDFLSDALNL